MLPSHQISSKSKQKHRNYRGKLNGLFKKISTPSPSLWTTLSWVPKSVRISKKDSSSFCRIPNPVHSKSWGVPEFCKTSNGFPGIRSKFTKLRGNSWISSHAHQAFTTRFPMSFMGGVWIFSGIAQCASPVPKLCDVHGKAWPGRLNKICPNVGICPFSMIFDATDVFGGLELLNLTGHH